MGRPCAQVPDLLGLSACEVHWLEDRLVKWSSHLIFFLSMCSKTHLASTIENVSIPSILSLRVMLHQSTSFSNGMIFLMRRLVVAYL